jgi:competence ComEA-like helix-hairpin-helix protein
MTRPPISGTRWFSLSGHELLVLAAAVAIALLAVGVTHVAERIRSRGSITVSEEPGALPMPARIDINTATGDELTMLRGIGPTRAAAIVEFRDKHGPFASLDELAGVKGIGDETIDGIRPDAMCLSVETNGKATGD